MKIRDTLRTKRTISFEFYPPKQPDGIPALFDAIGSLRAFRPNFVSVTYGAGGTTRALTEEIAVRIKRETDLEVMAHLTCAAQTREEVHGVLARLSQAGIENVIALRGDPPRGQSNFVPVEGGFAHASDLIEHIKRNFAFGIAAACYPEGHPESPDLETDLCYARLKVEKGADFLITQLFFDTGSFHEFVHRARKAGIGVPILAGILPILNTAQIRRFTSLCGAKIPPELDRQLDRYADDDSAVRELGIEYATRQVKELWDGGADGIHFYALNRSYSISRILTDLGLPEHTGELAPAARGLAN
jgi:methylenetetrahydrofolate reductase (NADPH)